MIISFSIENWMSYFERSTLSMVASRERQHNERVPRASKYALRLLPIASIYGGNASGKTNLFMALNFAKKFVVKGTAPDNLIPVEPFLLGDHENKQPSRFTFELFIDEMIYSFSFTVTRKEVLEEKLVLITSSSEKVLYERSKGKISFESSLKNNLFLDFAFQGTRENQLFLTNSVSQNVDDFRPVYNWFKDTLQLIAPDSRFGPFEQFIDEEQPLFNCMNEKLMQLDTGIVRLGSEVLSFDNLPLPESVKTRLREEIKEGTTVTIHGVPMKQRYIVTRKNNKLIAKKLITYHSNTEGKEIKFDIQNESDGSQRVIDLLPAFLDLLNKETSRVYVIDEIDRSLHTHLIKHLLETYLDSCSNESRSQLLFTTHDALLMDQQLLRRDEIWVTERDYFEKSTLFSFSEYKDIRFDKDIRKSYLQGRLGGVPNITLTGSLDNACIAKDGEEND
ncbi:MAG: AAA family ATPase [Bacillota bacterium]